MSALGRLLTFAALSAVAAGSGAAEAQVAIRGETVHTVAGPPIRDGVVVIRDGRITAVGPAGEVAIPEGFRVITGRVVTPGLVDARSVVGLAGYLNQPHDQDQLETSAPMQPELRALDAYNARETLVAWVRAHGVTTLHTGHAPGALIAGQTMVVKTRGDNVGQAVVDTVAMMAATLGRSVSGNFTSPGTRSKGVAMLRAELVRAQEYAARMRGPAANRPARDLRLEALAPVLDRRVPLLLTAHGIPEILAALRLQEEFGFELVLDGASEAYLVADEIRRAGVPVVLHPTMVRPSGEAAGASIESARRLRDAGITVAIQSGYEGYVPKTRVLVWEAAIAAANGLGFDDALRAITLDAARVIRQADRVGSLEVGKDGDVAVFDGDPFEYMSRVCAVMIEGEVVSEACH